MTDPDRPPNHEQARHYGQSGTHHRSLRSARHGDHAGANAGHRSRSTRSPSGDAGDRSRNDRHERQQHDHAMDDQRVHRQAKNGVEHGGHSFVDAKRPIGI